MRFLFVSYCGLSSSVNLIMLSSSPFWGDEHQLVEPSAEQHQNLRALAKREKKIWANTIETDAGSTSDPPDSLAEDSNSAPQDAPEHVSRL